MAKDVVAELGTPAATVGTSVVGWMLTGEVLWLTLLPSFGGALLSTYHRWLRGKRHARDMIYALLTATGFGAVVGPWIASMLPGDAQAGAACMCFVFAQLGTRSCEKLADLDWDFAAFMKALLDALPGGKK